MATCENTWGEDECFSCGSLSESEPCGKPAVICYDGLNWCADCADPNVLSLISWFDDDTADAENLKVILAALAPKGD